MQTSTQACWLTLSHLPLGARARRALLEHFGAVEKIFAADRNELQELLVTSAPRTMNRAEAIDLIMAGLKPEVLAADQDWLNQPERHLVTWFDSDYPPLLREIPDPPMVMYVHGRRSALNHPQIAIVGSRNPTPGGKENAFAFGRTLVQAGLTVTSGLALGIDGAAHKGALEAGGQTLAVAGTGLDRVYPSRHRELAHAVVAQGALLSEFALGTGPRPENFPVRNRIISGLCLGVLVVEAALESGSLITARLAAEQGREVFALPGSIHSPLARGCHTLIRQGAKLVECTQDILEELGPLAHVARSVSVSKSELKLDVSEESLLACLGYDPVTIDVLVERCGLTADAVSSMLLQLELRGLVAHGIGGAYQRILRV